jgi:SAM-dependent methyltransferase
VAAVAASSGSVCAEAAAATPVAAAHSTAIIRQKRNTETSGKLVCHSDKHALSHITSNRLAPTGLTCQKTDGFGLRAARPVAHVRRIRMPKSSALLLFAPTLFPAALLLAAQPANAQLKMLGSTPEVQNPLALPLVPPIAEAPVVRYSLMMSASDQSLGDDKFQPEIGQAGKDVIWVPTPDTLVKAMLTTAEVKPTDIVVDLGSGDGKIAIAAARDFGARARGVEYNPDMVALARRNAQRAGVAGKASFQQGDIFETDFSDATVITMYLLPSLNLKLRDTLMKMKPGTRIVSHAFNLGEWEPERTISTDEATGYFWIVPANMAGRWAFEIGTERFAAELGQQFQMLTPARGGPLKDGRIRGTGVTFTRANGQQLQGELKGNQIVGNGWVATRIKPTG